MGEMIHFLLHEQKNKFACNLNEISATYTITKTIWLNDCRR
jgi:hypothetical protein